MKILTIILLLISCACFGQSHLNIQAGGGGTINPNSTLILKPGKSNYNSGGIRIYEHNPDTIETKSDTLKCEHKVSGMVGCTSMYCEGTHCCNDCSFYCAKCGKYVTVKDCEIFKYKTGVTLN